MSRDERITFVIECFLKAYAFCFMPKTEYDGGEINHIVRHSVSNGDCGLLVRMVINRLKHFGIELEAVSYGSHMFLRDNRTGLCYDSYYTAGSDARNVGGVDLEIITGDKLIEDWKSNFGRWAYKEKIVRLPFDCLLHGDKLSDVGLADELKVSQSTFSRNLLQKGAFEWISLYRSNGENPIEVARGVFIDVCWMVGTSIPQIAQALKYTIIKTFNKDNEFELDITSLSGIKLAKLSMRVGENKYASETEECTLEESVTSMPFFRHLDILREQIEMFMNNKAKTGVSLVPVKRALARDKKSNLIVEFEIDEGGCVLYAVEPKTPTYGAIVGYLK